MGIPASEMMNARIAIPGMQSADKIHVYDTWKHKKSNETKKDGVVVLI